MGIITNIKSRSMCKQCLFTNKNYKLCEKCGNYYAKGNGCSCTKTINKSIVNKWNLKPTFKFFKANKNDSIFLGIELEILYNGSKHPCTMIKKDWLYLKHDGSIGGQNSFEIVTYPLSWEWIKANKNEFDAIFDLTKRYKVTSQQNNSCGMHIHINREAFSTLTLYKFLRFFKLNKKYVQIISNRQLEDLTRWARIIDRDVDIKTISFGRNNNCRHSAINLNNAETIEIRIFKGTLNKNKFFLNIEFVKALYDFALEHSIDKMTENDFKKYVRNNEKEFPYLNKFIRIRSSHGNFIKCVS